MNFLESVNPKTKAIEKVAKITAELIDINPEAKANKNGTMFHNASIKFDNAKGESVTRGAIVYASNYAYGMTVGVTYAGKATVITDADGKQGVLLSLSHLTGAGSATLADFVLDAEVTASADLDSVK